MSYEKRIFRLGALLLLVLGAAACSPGGTGSSAQPAGQPTPAIQVDALPKNEAGVPLVARVNNIEITLPQYERMATRYQQSMVGASTPSAIVQTMIQQTLIEQAATQNGIVVSEEEVNQELQGLVESSGGADAWQTWLTQNNYTEEELRATLRETLLTTRMRDRVTGDLALPVRQVHARHILVKTQDEANQLLVRLRNGEDFAALAAQYSLDTSTSVNGGDLGWFTSEELLEPTLSQVAFQLQAGQIAGPIQSSLGYHIIQALESEERVIDPEKRAQLAQNRFESWLNTLTGTATIESYL